MKVRPILVTLALFSTIRTSAADEQMRVVAQSGDWVTMTHSDTMLSRPDVCLTLNVSNGVAFRASNEGVELRIIDKTWTLPVQVTGLIRVSVGKLNQDVEITSNTDSMVSGEVQSADLKPLFAEMDRQSAMDVVVGKAKSLKVSLVGSTVATNAFRTCAGIRGDTPAGGNNPFR